MDRDEHGQPQPTPDEWAFAKQAVEEIWELTGWTWLDEASEQATQIYRYDGLLDE